MKGYSPKLPLTLDSIDGFRLTRSLKEVVSQNLKMLILTSPGERIMEPTFGVGLYNVLFELNTEDTRLKVREKIFQQVRKYMPFVKIDEIAFSSPESEAVDRNLFEVSIRYAIPSIGSVSVLTINID